MPRTRDAVRLKQKLRPAGVRRTPRAALAGSEPVQKSTGLNKLSECRSTPRVGPLMRPDDAERALASACCRPLLGRGRSCLLRRRARRLVAVAAIEIGMGDAHSAALIWAGPGVPVPRCLRSVRPGNITRVDVRVDIGLRIRRLYPDDHRQNAQATDQNLLHQSSSLSTRKCHTFYW